MDNKVYEVEVMWKDDKTTFTGLICSMDCIPKGYNDDDIFFYGLSETDMKNSNDNDGEDFVIKRYQLVK